VKTAAPIVIEITYRLARLFKRCTTALLDDPDFEDRWDEWRDGVGSDIERSLRCTAAPLHSRASVTGALGACDRGRKSSVLGALLF
jgi:hypothetical protein